jgi:cytochrome c oxidase subunit 6b
MPSANPTTTTITPPTSIKSNVMSSTGNLESSSITEHSNDDADDTQQQPLIMDTFKLRTVDFDARFPNTNQTKHCWQKYVDYQKCIKILGDGHPDCQAFQRDYRSLCPYEWVSL